MTVSSPYLAPTNPASLQSEGWPGLTRRRKLLFTGAVCGVGLLACLVAGECYCRYMFSIEDRGWFELTDDPILFYRLTTGVNCFDNGNHRTQTAQRLRGPLVFAPDPPPGTYRVVWLGDSACFGCGVGDEETAAFVLHRMAQQRGLALESLNLAVVGYNVRQAREVLKQRGPEFRGLRTVVYFHHINDIVNATWIEVAPFTPWELYWRYERPGPPWVKCLKRSTLVRRVGHSGWVTRLLGRTGEGEPATFESSAPQRPPPADSFLEQCASLYTEESRYGVQFRDDLYAMADEARNQDAELILVYWPVQPVLGHALSEKLCQRLAPWCRAKGIVVIDLTEDYLANQRPGLYADPTHPGPLGHRLVAEAVWKHLQPDPQGP